KTATAKWRIWAAAACFGLTAVLVAVMLLRSPGENKPAQSLAEYYEGIYGEIRTVAYGDYMQYDYDALFRQASVVAIVTPLDSLTEENTEGISETGMKKYYGLHSLRKVKAVKYYKNEPDYGESFTIVEQCGVVEGNTLVVMDACYPMEEAKKGAYYLVFLHESGYGYPAAISADNGRFDLTHLSLNTHKEVLVDALFSLGLADTEGHDGLLEQAAAAIRLGMGDLDEINGMLAQGGKWYPQWKLYALSSYKEDLGKAETDELLRRTDEWDSFVLTTKYTDKAYAVKIAYSDEGAGKIYRINGPEAYIDPDDGRIFYVGGEFLA
ncbi:MAG: hypothetical protein J6P71_08470, partial [Oscillospiraceae bacterium]|nr:hypothetical protein [Oscillospiraceae bacterium]